ncbi:uncharacterized protein LOC108912029 [Anoplophora glabripennis]|uniref:uncharacterized protein LOC108912029 n=1 Tax=Anoplophora glabripennis TaxID=217634 RepID=UPI000873F0D4|nr:uncharacterized protein LOC108912029 [Anoplophora glabripennis]
MKAKISVKSKPSVVKAKIIPFASHIVLTVINLYCLVMYYTNIMGKNFLDLGYVAYLTMFMNGLVGLSRIVNEEAFLDLRILLDYGQVVLSHPFLTAVLWQKHDAGPKEIAVAHCLLGLTAFLFFAFMEYKRLDLSDLALIISIPSSIIVGALFGNYFACGAGVLMALAYFGLKRGEDCILQTSPVLSGTFNFAMAAYAILTLVQFEPEGWIPKF